MNKTGKIYKMENQYGVYYGSTIVSLNQRLSEHKYDAKNRNCTSKILFQNGCIPKIELLEEVEFDNIKELRYREAYYIRNLDCVNIQIPDRTPKEWMKKNQEKKKEYDKVYFQKNKEQNKEKIAQQKKKWYETNKDKIAQRNKIKISCNCGSVVRKSVIQRHYKTKKHLKYIETNNI